MLEPESKAKMVKGNLKEGEKTFHPILVTQKQKKPTIETCGNNEDICLPVTSKLHISQLQKMSWEND